MKITTTLLAMGMTALFCCSIGKADSIIYSNNFTLGTAVNISNTPPTAAFTYAGGNSNAVWQDVDGTANTHGPLLANGIDTCAQIDYWALPFTPQSNFVYLLTVNMTFTNNPGIAPEFGFSQLFTTNYPNDARFNGSTSGYDWMAVTESSGNVQYFAGAKTANTIASINGIFPANTASTNTFQILLDTESSPWSVAGYANGVQAGSLFTYSPNPTGLVSVGISQNGTPSNPTAIQYNQFVLSTTLLPFIVRQPTAQTTIGGGSTYTNMATTVADPNGGPLSYQWYANNAPLTNGVNNVSGANSNLLTISPVEAANGYTNYYVTVSNNYGLFKSSFASVTVLTNPVIIAPTSLSNAINLFTGSGPEVGSSPTFSVTAIGAPPLSYYWLTNGVVVAGATNTSISFTNLQSGSVISYMCTVSNSYGTASAAWYPTYTTAPTAGFPQAVLGDIPLEFWRLNETGGTVAYDSDSGNNGVYTNVTLGQPGYNNTSEPGETSVFVTASGNQPSMAGQIGNLDLARTMSNGVNAEFTVEGWANCISGNGATGGAPVVSQGVFQGSSFFLGVDTNATTKHYQFYVRNAAGTLYSADDSSMDAQDVTWHYLVGVCDEANSNVSLYIDGRLAASAVIPTNSGNFESGMPIAIGAGIRSGSATYNVPFTGYLDDIAIYKHALSWAQVINHFVSEGGQVPAAFGPPLVPATFPYLANQTLTIPANVGGSGPLGYYWTNVTTGGPVLASGSIANSGSLNATLTIPNASAGLSGDQLELVVTNSFSSANTTVTLFNPPPPIALDASNPILYSNLFNGGTWSIAGMPLTAANILVGGTNTTWTDALGSNDIGGSVQASGIPGTAQADSWLLPFTPHSGYVYTLSASLTWTGNPGNWLGLGFTQLIPNNTTNGDGRFADGPNVAYDWQILTESTGNVQYFAGASGNGTVISANSYFTAGVGTHSEQIVLDTTGAQWKYYSVVDSKVSATNTYGSGVPSGASSTNPPIGAVGFEQNGMTLGSQNLVQWNYFTLTQVAPGGVPPYLLNPLPRTNNIVLSNETVTISATAFGSAPFGYHWINNSSVISSGSTNNMEPLPADLSISSSSLSVGTLQLVVTNAYGTNITSIALVNPVNPNPTNITYSVTGGQLTLSWPPDHTGWTLQAQTNNPGKGLGTNWVNVANSSTTNQVAFPMSSTNGSVFFRLTLP